MSCFVQTRRKATGLLCCLLTMTGIAGFEKLKADEAKELCLAERYMHQGKLGEAEVQLAVALDEQTNNDQLRLQLGMIQFMRAVEKLGQALYQYGAFTANSRTMFLQLPVPKNPNPSELGYHEFGRVLDCFATDLMRADSTLRQIKDNEVKMPIRLAGIELDFDGKGQQKTKLSDILLKLNGGRQFGFLERNPEMRIHFDRGDVAWLRAYCHLLAGAVDTYRTFDEEVGFAARVDRVFPKVETNQTQLPNPTNDGLNIVDARRLRSAREHFVAVCELNQETWKYIRAETDDDFEWLSTPLQTDQLNMPITDRQIDAWLHLTGELGKLLRGELIIPGSLLDMVDGGNGRPNHSGLNLRKVLDDPPTDLLSLSRIRNDGIDKKYLAKESEIPPINVGDLIRSFQAFDGPFAFGYAIRLN